MEKITQLSTDKLHFDPQNPRFYRLGSARMSDDEIISEMMESEGVQDLMESIGAKGYFPGEPLLVVKQGDKYIVVEGNRRLAATKLLNAEIGAPPRRERTIEQIRNESQERPVSLPCVVCNDREEVVRYLGFRHVAGIKEWDSLSKAYYVRKRLDAPSERGSYKDKLNDIRKQIGTNTDYLARLMASLELYSLAEEEFFAKLKLEPKDIEFSLITTALSYKDIKSWLGIEDFYEDIRAQLVKNNVKLMFKFLFVVRNDATTIIKESRQLRDFSYIVRHKEAIDTLIATGDIETARLFTEGPSEVALKLLRQSSRRLEQVLNHLGKADKQPASDEHISEAEKITNLVRTILSLMKGS